MWIVRIYCVVMFCALTWTMGGFRFVLIVGLPFALFIISFEWLGGLTMVALGRSAGAIYDMIDRKLEDRPDLRDQLERDFPDTFGSRTKRRDDTQQSEERDRSL